MLAPFDQQNLAYSRNAAPDSLSANPTFAALFLLECTLKALRMCKLLKTYINTQISIIAHFSIRNAGLNGAKFEYIIKRLK